MSDTRPADRYRRRLLRLGALLFQLKYYMQAPADIEAHLYRRSSHVYVQVVGESVRLVDGEQEETVSLEEAIARCKAALRGESMHRPQGGA